MKSKFVLLVTLAMLFVACDPCAELEKVDAKIDKLELKEAAQKVELTKLERADASMTEIQNQIAKISKTQSNIADSQSKSDKLLFECMEQGK